MFELKQDDDNLKHLSVEEQSALLFFEETLKSFQDDLPVNGSTRLQLDEAAADDSEPEDIIDLVPAAYETSKLTEVPEAGIVIPSFKKEPEHQETPLVKYSPLPLSPRLPAMEPPRSNDIYSENSVEHHKLLGAIPTPVLIAEQICKIPVDNGSLSPTSPKPDRHFERRKDAATSPPPFHRDYFHFPSTNNGKLSHYPNNIVINKAGKEYNTTISKANVNVLQRKAQVLANLHRDNLSADELADRVHHSQMIGRDRSVSFRDCASQQAKYEALIKLKLIKETSAQVDSPSDEVETDRATNAHKLKFSAPKSPSNEFDNISKILSSEPSPFIPAGKTICIPGAAPPTEKLFSHQNPSHSIHEPSQSRVQNDIRRTCSLPRPAPFRAHGISVQFSGRGATEESRKEALRQLGLLKKSA